MQWPLHRRVARPGLKGSENVSSKCQPSPRNNATPVTWLGHFSTLFPQGARSQQGPDQLWSACLRLGLRAGPGHAVYAVSLRREEWESSRCSIQARRPFVVLGRSAQVKAPRLLSARASYVGHRGLHGQQGPPGQGHREEGMLAHRLSLPGFLLLVCVSALPSGPGARHHHLCSWA